MLSDRRYNSRGVLSPRLVAFLLGIVFLVLSGLYCSQQASVRPTPPPPGSAPRLPDGAVWMFGPNVRLEDRETWDKALGHSLEKTPDEILVISAGGARGAFSAGFLKGWTDSGERPEFDVVTGVSVGSLLAVFAFLGPDYDSQAAEVFTKHQVLGHISWHSANGALYDDVDFKKLIAGVYDAQVLEAVAKRHREGARLLVGSTDLDSTSFVVWDLGALAARGDAEALNRFHEILQASCSMPVVFPPVYFELTEGGEKFHQMHVDGGLRAPVFLPDPIMENAAPDARVSVIVNHSLHVGHSGGPETGMAIDIGLASFKILLGEKLLFMLDELVDRGVRHELDLRIVGIPDDLAQSELSILPQNATRDPKKLYDGARSLYEKDAWVLNRVE